jgi:hypothetical protein
MEWEETAMGVDDLVETVRRVRELASNHQALLAQNEALTRYCLIDPLLRALGWDTSDPEQVRVEESAGGGKADYLLLDSDGSFLLLIEAKKVAEKLPVIAATEVIKYAGHLLSQGKQVKLLVITNGLSWEIYEYPSLTLRTKLDLGDRRRQAEDVALDLARALWQPLLRTIITAPVTSPSLEPSPSPLSILSGLRPSHPVASAAATGVIPLSDFVKRVVGGARPPKRLIFPDGSSTSIAKWRDFLVEVTRYLLRAGELRHRLPVRRHTRYLVSSNPIHPGGHDFFNPVEVDGVYVETNYSAQSCVQGAIQLIRECGQDPTAYKIEL